jgi:hypothetical protein
MVGKPEGKRLQGRSRNRSDNIKMGLEEIGWRIWTGLIWVRLGISEGLF